MKPENPILVFLRLIRWKNLLFIAVLQWLVFFCLINPLLTVYGVNAGMMLPNWQFFLLMGATVLIAAGGYVINDYFDMRIDQINRPGRVIVGTVFTKSQASLIHQICTALGVVMGLVVAWQCRSLSLALVIAMVPGLLWFYSASYKRQFLMGNVVIALNAMFVPLVVAIAEVAYLSKDSNFGELIFSTPIAHDIYLWVCGFAAFAFLLTFIREIIKDIQDETGDREMESRTLPIKLGIFRTKIVLYALLALAAAALLHAQFVFIDSFELFGEETGSLSVRYIIFGLLLPLAYLMFLLIKAKTPADYRQASTFCKFIMIIGSLYLLVFYFLLAKGQGIAMFDLFMIK